MIKKDKKCTFCSVGYFIPESWASDKSSDPNDFYCNNCFKRMPKSDNKVIGRGGAVALDSDEDEYDELEEGWFSWRGI